MHSTTSPPHPATAFVLALEIGPDETPGEESSPGPYVERTLNPKPSTERTLRSNPEPCFLNDAPEGIPTA